MLKSPADVCFADKEVELLQFVGGQVAIAIERKQLTSELRRMAQYDELTGLPNRRLFHDRVNAALARCRRQHNRLALLFVDIDKFKQANDTHGHAVGDLLLQELAIRLEPGLRQEDTVFRLGGDEFVVLLEDLQRREDAFTGADKLRKMVCQPVYVAGLALKVRASLGIALYPKDGLDLEALLKHSD